MLHALQQDGVLLGSIDEGEDIHCIHAEVILILRFIIDHVVHFGNIGCNAMVHREYLERHLNRSILQKDFEKDCYEVHRINFTFSQEV